MCRKLFSFERLEARDMLSANVLYRINAGGSALAGTPGWSVDGGFTNTSDARSGSSTSTVSINTSHASIPTDTPAALFMTERWDDPRGQEMQWNIAVTPGQVEVRLYFAEMYSATQAAGGRVFDVAIEGQTVLDNYDIFADVGGYRGVMKSYVVTSDANLDIDLQRVVQNPTISGIEILTLPARNQLIASQSTIDFGGVLIGNTVTRTLTLTNPGSATTDAPAIVIAPEDLQIVGASAGLFAAAMPSGASVTLAAGQSMQIDIRFSASDAAAKQATLSIAHSGDNTPLSVELSGSCVSSVPIGFGRSTLSGENASRPTSLQFGPDGRLYVAQQDGVIRVFTIARQGPNDYRVIGTETITAVQQILNHNDNGAPNPSIAGRLVTGLLVTGTAQRPVIYVTSSDPRVGAGSSGEDVNLDTNSGILSRLTWNGGAWVKLDLVRGLPRSEENHASNGLALDAVSNILYIAQGGLTNMGAPSNNFAMLPEYAMSAAILSVDLGAIGEATYDLPTLDDEDRPGTVDANDPFGGNDGKNQAKLVPGGPVQVYAPGFRNPFDVVLTSSGRLYTIDNGPNGGWGDVPVNEGPQGNATNGRHEPGTTYGDGLHFITGPGFYGGHPNPTRSNPLNTFNSSQPQSPVAHANPIESDYLIPGIEDGSLFVWGASTNGLTEYTASNFQGTLRGDLLAASFDNSIKRVKTAAAGDAVALQETLFSSVSGTPLDVTALGDDGPFPGTIWVASIGNGAITVFEPSDFDGHVGADPGDENDSDGDGYLNDDELANGTNPASAADFPADWDEDFVSNLVDSDDDNDGMLDHLDPFAIDPHNGLSTPIGVAFNWENEASNVGGLLNAGFTGLMSNGVDNYESLFDDAKLTSGGAAGVLTLDEIGEGDASGALNTQQQAFQLGVNIGGATTPVTAHTRVLAAFAGEVPQGQQSFGLFVGTGDQDNYVKIVVAANGGASVITYQKEVAGVVTAGEFDFVALPGPAAIDLYLTVDVMRSTVQAHYRIDGGEQIDLGGPIAVPVSWLAGQRALAVGIISTSVGPAQPIAVTWDLIEMTADPVQTPPTVTMAFQDNLFPTISYNGTRDTKISSGSRNTNFGTARTLDVDGSPDVAGLLLWDVAAIPVGSVVESVAIELNVTNASRDDYELYIVQRAWDELSATWRVAAIGDAWSAAGAAGAADRGTTAVGTLVARNNGIQRIQLDAAGVAAVQSWVNHPGQNRGVILQDFANSDGLDFSSSEATVVAPRPKLIVTYRPASGSTPTLPPVPVNLPPIVSAGVDLTIQLPGMATLAGNVADDGRPTSPGAVIVQWWRVAGPGTVVFSNASSMNTTAQFSVAGTYVLRLTADDGEHESFDELIVTVLEPVVTSPTKSWTSPRRR